MDCRRSACKGNSVSPASGCGQLAFEPIHLGLLRHPVRDLRGRRGLRLVLAKETDQPLLDASCFLIARALPLVRVTSDATTRSTVITSFAMRRWSPRHMAFHW